MIIAKKLHINNRKKMDVVKDLTKFRFQKFGDDKAPRTGFEYLLIMQIASLTKEKKEELERMAKEKGAELERVKKMTIQHMWLHDLAVLEKAINELYDGEAEELGGDAKKNKDKKKAQTTTAMVKKAGKKGKGKKRKGGKDEDEGPAGGEGGGDGDDDMGDDLLSNPVTDVSRWTSSYLKPITGAGIGGGKKRGSANLKIVSRMMSKRTKIGGGAMKKSGGGGGAMKSAMKSGGGAMKSAMKSVAMKSAMKSGGGAMKSAMKSGGGAMKSAMKSGGSAMKSAGGPMKKRRMK